MVVNYILIIYNSKYTLEEHYNEVTLWGIYDKEETIQIVSVHLF